LLGPTLAAGIAGEVDGEDDEEEAESLAAESDDAVVLSLDVSDLALFEDEETCSS